MSDQTYEQLALWLTPEEVEAKVADVVKNLTETHDREVNLKLTRARNEAQAYALAAVRAIKDEVADEETLITTYNAIAEACGWDTITSLIRKFAVSVEYNGYTIGEFSDVEADDEDSACNTVLEHMDIEASLSLNISYGNDSCSGDIDIDAWDLDSDNFTATAEEQL